MSGFIIAYKIINLIKSALFICRPCVKLCTVTQKFPTAQWATGATTGAHLHFQLEYGGVPIDPLPYITGEDMVEADVPDADLDNIPADWAAEAVQWARENGVLYGDDTGNLHLHEAVTCERMLVFLYRTYTKIKEDLGI